MGIVKVYDADGQLHRETEYNEAGGLVSLINWGSWRKWVKKQWGAKKVIPCKVSTYYKSEYLDKPFYATEGSAGFDLIAAIRTSWEVIPGASVSVPTGLWIEIPEGYFGDVRPRSGLARKHSMILSNAPGTIDLDYRGQIMVTLLNLSKKIYTIKPEDRIAQMIVQPFERVQFVREGALSSTERGEGGHGHSGD